MAIGLYEVIKEEQKMLTIFADALLLAVRQSPLPYPKHERPKDIEGDHAVRRLWLKYAELNR